MCKERNLNRIYRIAGYFQGANISRLAVLVNFTEKISWDPRSVWFRIQPHAIIRYVQWAISSTFFRDVTAKIREIFFLENNRLYSMLNTYRTTSNIRTCDY